MPPRTLGSSHPKASRGGASPGKQAEAATGVNGSGHKRNKQTGKLKLNLDILPSTYIHPITFSEKHNPSSLEMASREL